MTSGSGPSLFGPDSVAGHADWQTVAVVAQPSQPNEPGGRGEDFGKSSPVGLLVLLLFFIAVGFLVRSMTKHLKRVPASFEKDAEQPADGIDQADAADATEPEGKAAATSAVTSEAASEAVTSEARPGASAAAADETPAEEKKS